MAAKQRPYRLQYLPVFWSDLNAALAYVSEVLEAPKAAESLLARTEAGILNYLKDPVSAAVYKTKRQRPLPYYWFGVGNYMVFYVVFDDVMEVRRFLYGASDLTRIAP